MQLIVKSKEVPRISKLKYPRYAWKISETGIRASLQMNALKHIVSFNPAINLFHRRVVIVQQHVKVDQPLKGSHFEVVTQYIFR